MQMMVSARRTRRTHSPTIGAQAVLASLQEDRPTAELCAKFHRNLNHISERTNPVRACANEASAGGASPEPVNLGSWHAKPVPRRAEEIRPLALMRKFSVLHLERLFLAGRRLRRGIEARMPLSRISKRPPRHQGHQFLLRKRAITCAKPFEVLDNNYISIARSVVDLTAAVDAAPLFILANGVVIPLDAIQAREVIEQSFACYGHPGIVSNDQGRQFAAIEFIATVCLVTASSRGRVGCLAAQHPWATLVAPHQIRARLRRFKRTIAPTALTISTMKVD